VAVVRVSRSQCCMSLVKLVASANPLGAENSSDIQD
jgi:hypothetical protein